MKLEKFNYSSGKRGRWFLYGFILAVVLMVLINIFLSEAKYYNIESIPIAKGTIKNYSPTDFKLLAIKLENDSGEYDSSNTIPESGYVLNEEKSYCSIPNDEGKEMKDGSVIINYHNGMVDFSNLTTKNTKCYLYFDIMKQLINYVMLYDNGEEFEEITGGWDASISQVNNTINIFWYTNNNMENDYVGIAHYSTLNLIGGSENGFNMLFGYTINHYYWWDEYNAGLAKFVGNNGLTNSKVFNSLEASPNSGYGATWGTFNNSFNRATGNTLKTSNSLYFKVNYLSYITYECYLHNFLAYKSDNWQELIKITNITASTIDDILVNSTTLLSNETAVKYMIYNCTGDFMVSAIQNETFMNALNTSEYKDLVYENEHWSKFLSMVS